MTLRRQPSDRASPWWDAARHADRRPWLLARNAIKAAIRAQFATQGFVEVETACLQVSPGNEAHLHAFATTGVGSDLRQTPLYLHTSPEFACKKLLAAGETKLFTFAPAFRNRERGALHAPEFTMLEWYRVGSEVADLIEDCAAILALAARVSGLGTWHWRGAACVATNPICALTVAEAFQQVAGIELAASLTEAGPDRARLDEQARVIGVRVSDTDTWSDIFSRILVERIEPHLGVGAPTALMRYPSAEAALARPCADDPRFAERFELYVAGVELGNGFGELTDPVVQRRRFEVEMDEKARIYGERYPVDEDFLAALAHMPPSAGIAVGFDRLVMLATGARSIDDVIWTPHPDPQM